MKSGRLVLPAVAALAAFGPAPSLAAPDPSAIPSEVATFYRWYLRRADENTRQPEFLRAGIDRFITHRLKARLRREYLSSSLSDDADPFLQVQDFADHMSVAVASPTGLPNDPRVVVHLGSFEPLAICVHVVSAGQRWEIGKVDVNDAPGAPADCKTRTLS